MAKFLILQTTFLLKRIESAQVCISLSSGIGSLESHADFGICLFLFMQQFYCTLLIYLWSPHAKGPTSMGETSASQNGHCTTILSLYSLLLPIVGYATAFAT